MKPEPVEISRLFHATQRQVFDAWSTGERVARWFAPEHCSVPQAQVDFRKGGVFAVTMRLPDGQDSLCRGAFEEVTPPSRLAFVMDVEMAGKVRFRVHTVVDFAAEGVETRMTVRQSYELYDDAFAGAPAGAREGWRTTLDKLAREVARSDGAVVHGVFTIIRDLPHPPALVYRAFADMEAKSRWFGGGDDWSPIQREMDVRPGGREIAKGRWKSGVVTTFDAVYLDVVVGERLVYAYNLLIDERKISVSLATVEIQATPGGSRLRITEQGAFLDGYDDAGQREHGTRLLVERIAESL